MRTTTAWQSTGGSTVLDRVTIERRDLRADDVAVRIDYCGVCHTDLHSIHGAEGRVVPGHEFTGVVAEVGADVTEHAVGDRVAVGTIIDSCGTCAMCVAGQEPYCFEGVTLTYGPSTDGGYSREYVLRADFVHALPDGLDPVTAAPLLCAGISVYQPLKAAGVKPGDRVGVAGLGGLGHLAVKFAAAMGAEVTMLSRTADKVADAERLGASGLLLTTDEAALAEARGSFDVIIDTIPVQHDVGPFLRLVGLDGTVSVVGHLGSLDLAVMDLLAGRKRLTSSGVGGRPDTREMLAFAAEHGVSADVELLPSAQVGEALERLEAGDVRYRFVLDLSDLD